MQHPNFGGTMAREGQSAVVRLFVSHLGFVLFVEKKSVLDKVFRKTCKEFSLIFFSMFLRIMQAGAFAMLLLAINISKQIGCYMFTACMSLYYTSFSLSLDLSATASYTYLGL